MKTTANTCPKCGGIALFHPLSTDYDPIDRNFFEETLQCVDCGAIWSEIYEKQYLGYRFENIDYSKSGAKITIKDFIG